MNVPREMIARKLAVQPELFLVAELPDCVVGDNAEVVAFYEAIAYSQEARVSMPPKVCRDDVVRHLGDDDENPGWFLGVTADGVEGYFPCRWFQRDADGVGARALRDYDAMELTIEANVEVGCLAEEPGWVLFDPRRARRIPLRGWVASYPVLLWAERSASVAVGLWFVNDARVRHR